jgi:hypothetical protein
MRAMTLPTTASMPRSIVDDDDAFFGCSHGYEHSYFEPGIIIGPEGFLDTSLDEEEKHLEDLYAGCLALRRLGEWLQLVPERDSIALASIYRATDDVFDFLNENSLLVDILNEAAPKLQNVFGDQVEVELELFSDPESPIDNELFARVLTRLRAGEALDLLDRFDDEWWLDESPKARCLLNFALRYI